MYTLTINAIGKVLPYGVFKIVGAVRPTNGHAFQKNAQLGLHLRIVQHSSSVIALIHF